MVTDQGPSGPQPGRMGHEGEATLPRNTDPRLGHRLLRTTAQCRGRGFEVGASQHWKILTSSPHPVVKSVVRKGKTGLLKVWEIWKKTCITLWCIWCIVLYCTYFFVS